MILDEEYKRLQFSVMQFFLLPITSSLFIQRSFSTPCSQTPSVYVPPLMSENKFHIHTEPQATL
jgi:hypothetical protein